MFKFKAIKHTFSNFKILIFAILTLALAIVLRLFFIDDYLNPQRFSENIEQKVQLGLSQIESEIDRIKQYSEDTDRLSFTALNLYDDYPFFFFQDGRLIYWSTNWFVPDYKGINGEYQNKYVDIPQGKFVVRKFQINEDVEGYALLPLYFNFKIDNKYVEPGFNENIFSSSDLTIHNDSQKPDYQIDISNEYLFSVDFEETYRSQLNPFTLLIALLVVVSLILIIVFISSIVNNFKKHSSYDKGFLFLTGSIVILRFLMLLADFPIDLIELQLFNSMYYASSAINPSLGDLLLNVIGLLIITIYLFRYFYRFQIYHWLINSKDNTKAIFSIFLVFIGYLVLYAGFSLIQSINFHSQWSLDINYSISFSYLKIVSLVIIYILAVITFLVIHILYKVFIKMNQRSRFFLAFDLVIGTLLFITVALALQVSFFIIAVVGFLYFMVLYLLDLPQYLTNIQYKTLFYFFSAAIMLAIIGSYAVYDYKKEQNADQRADLADLLLMEHDYYGEILLFEAREKISNDVFIKNWILNNTFIPNEIIERKIKRVYLSNYFDKYEINVLLFGANGKVLGDDNAGINYYELKSRLEEFETDYENIFFLNQRGMNIPKRYLVFIPINRFDYNVGNILIELNLKRIVPNSVYPELLVDQSYVEPYAYDNEYNDYSYAIINDGQISYSSGSFNYIRNFEKPLLLTDEIYEDGIKDDGYIHFAKRGTEDQVIIVSNKAYPFIHAISNFSFLFLFIIFITLILLGSYSLYFAFTSVNLNYAAKIQLYSNFAFFLPLLVVSITTLSLLISSNKQEVESEYLQKAESISYELIDPLYNFNRNEGISSEELSSQLLQISNYANLDINLFNVNGKLITSSQPMIYESNMLSEYINPGAIAEVIEQRNNSIILDESVGTLTYKSTYVAIKYFFTGEIIGILSIPFFESKYELDNQIIEIFTYIINIFTFIFILFLLISYFASKWLTFPLRLITHKIRRTSLAEYNEPLTWNSDDEIGLLVKEYNKMLVNLEDSKKALAKSQKESAWREIARQVAHEIKNPLTPMKLTLQHLKRMMESDTPGKDNIAEKPINTLLHQINTLSDIAESFSAFAKMPIPESERFEISSVLRKTVNLYINRDHGKINTNIQDGEFYIIGDEQWMGRIFSNLIINGFQAVPKDREPFVEVSLFVANHNKVCIEIKDNGTGIPESIREKIFIPNFSTKYQGSGIGLAVAKRGVEHAGGKIWFDTEEDKGTSFFIELPLQEKNIYQ